MDNSFQTSFIPKKPVTSNFSNNKEGKSLFLIIGIFVLVVSVVASALLFLYKNNLTKQRESASTSLSMVRDSFDKNTIDELGLYNKRTDAVKQILTNHIILSPMFTLLGDVTIPQVQYTKFDQQINGGVYSVKIVGVARDYRAIAIQADVFNSSKGNLFKNVVFSNLGKDKKNNITFNLEFNVDPGLLSYENNSLASQIQTSDSPVSTDTPLSKDLVNVTP